MIIIQNLTYKPGKYDNFISYNINFFAMGTLGSLALYLLDILNKYRTNNQF